MPKPPTTNGTTGRAGVAAVDPDLFVLRLFVAGATPQSTRAIVDARRLCDEHLAGRFTLEVVDIYQQPLLARDEQIIAVPTLVRKRPSPLRKLVGDLSDTRRVLAGLDLAPAVPSDGPSV